MTSVSATAIPEQLIEENFIASIADGYTYVSKRSAPKIVHVTPYIASATAIVTATISGRTITFNVVDTDGAAHADTHVYMVTIKGHL